MPTDQSPSPSPYLADVETTCDPAPERLVTRRLRRKRRRKRPGKPTHGICQLRGGVPVLRTTGPGGRQLTMGATWLRMLEGLERKSQRVLEGDTPYGRHVRAELEREEHRLRARMG